MKKVKKMLHGWMLRRASRKYGPEIVNAWVCFCYNYPTPAKEWMKGIYGTVMGKHFFDKFTHLYCIYGSDAMNHLWTEMTTDNRNILYKFFQNDFANEQYFK